MLSRIINTVISWVVGATFILSGIIKLNDPTGTAIKLEEYFEVFSTDFSPFFEHFVPYSMQMSIFLSTLEVCLGLALIIQYRKVFTLWGLFLILLFFGFLTFYSAQFDKVTDCGCFGDAIPLTPWESFFKDLALLVLTGYLLFQKRERSNYQNVTTTSLMLICLSACVGSALYSLQHLPFRDFRPYAVGLNIEKQMSGSVPCEHVYIMEKDGEEVQMKEYPYQDSSYIFVDMKTINEEDCMPKITDYYISDREGNDVTRDTFEGQKLLIIIESVAKAKESEKTLAPLVDLLDKLPKEVEAIVYTADPDHIEAYLNDHSLKVKYYIADGTLLKAMIRSNPGLILLKDAEVIKKWHVNDTPSLPKLEKFLVKEVVK
ncbi:BT_3928 family protein [Sediminitomix flava]|uniref:Methylamine utilisation protein MauE domain-containing protein n=1 Tax=Sediminitomix flava TaxID=379075 RepID=A0A315ZFZ2_SEDFL|nr:BT_3928 family protein [Sediminitomix flava]PWJ44073.1 hypothetical protein BC781_101423 [Sediminitomix flava]